ncbi:MAG: succinylglutamate desuccinylase/aspartoacylase family protein, partial [Planctomycetes bacterium]|nr:succinylglutamate desuccinylase/aspartoacylase family protein [Planctomycetota bacterium]
MGPSRERKPIDVWNGQRIGAEERRDVKLAVSESYSGMTVRIPLHIRRGPRDGPTVFVTAALHGDEINGTGAVRQLVQDPDFRLLKGNIILVPVLNILSFDRHARYLPDRRDLNRCFPGSARGSLASRMARTIFDEIVSRS